MDLLNVILILLIPAAIGIGWMLRVKIDKAKINSTKEIVKRIIADAKKEAETIKKDKIFEAKDEAYKYRQKQEAELQRKRDEVINQERRLREREMNLSRKNDILERRESDLSNQMRSIEEKSRVLEVKESNLDKLIKEENAKLESIARMSSEEAVAQLKANLMDQAKQQSAEIIKEIRDKARAQANREAKEIIVSAIQRSAADHSVESTVSVVNLPSDEIKGRIIGREGRNIRAFENATGVEIIVDDTPEAVIISGFDPMKREVAKMAMEKLMTDGRIHPGRIEDAVKKSEMEMEEMLVNIGEQALLETGVHGVHPELVKLLGKLQFRTSYGQNVLQHSKEVSVLAGLMASEIGLDAKLAKRSGLLHDIGKSVDQVAEGTHTTLGAELAKKYKESKIVINAIAAHHEDVESTSLIAVLVQAADAISSSRPGARRETLEGYIKRLEKLEEIAESFHGVSKSFAIQAGREIRIIVEHDKVSDAQAEQLSYDIANRIQDELEYPGQIKVVVIREFRTVEYAK
ncbi:ribonuclease Y [bacterium]|nr:ribonuclease Y [FCB group bacterium]MBL7192043.1 ribonuclease Y [bacterium]